MSHINESIDVEVPVRTAYDQWTQFETFPKFMEGVDRVIQLDDKSLDWTATIAGKVKHWRAEITQQEPDRIVAWRSVDGARNDGEVTFQSLSPTSTRVSVDLEVDPDGLLESAGDALGFVARRAKGDLERFKEFIEQRGSETGAWRGEIESGRVVRDDNSGGTASSTPIAGGSLTGDAGHDEPVGSSRTNR
jgi:uncharacterized membrane protein